jgi:hypothetical protein
MLLKLPARFSIFRSPFSVLWPQISSHSVAFSPTTYITHHPDSCLFVKLGEALFRGSRNLNLLKLSTWVRMQVRGSSPTLARMSLSLVLLLSAVRVPSLLVIPLQHAPSSEPCITMARIALALLWHESRSRVVQRDNLQG